MSSHIHSGPARMSVNGTAYVVCNFRRLKSVSTSGWFVSYFLLLKAAWMWDMFYQEAFTLTVGTLRKILAPVNLPVCTCLQMLLSFKSGQTRWVNYCNWLASFCFWLASFSFCAWICHMSFFPMFIGKKRITVRTDVTLKQDQGQREKKIIKQRFYQCHSRGFWRAALTSIKPYTHTHTHTHKPHVRWLSSRIINDTSL